MLLTLLLAALLLLPILILSLLVSALLVLLLWPATILEPPVPRQGARRVIRRGRLTPVEG